MSSSVPLSVKWGKEVIEFTFGIETGPKGLKRELEERTGVPAERQKVMAKTKGLWKGVLKDDIDLTSLVVATSSSPPWQLLLMGSAAELSAPKVKTVFLEDLPLEERAKVMPEPSGLINLGNTCYLNSVVQCLRAIPPLRRGLQSFGTTNSNNNNNSMRMSSLLVMALRDTLNKLDRTTEAVSPDSLVRATKLNFPHFAQADARGHPRQQDAEEYYSQLMTVLAHELTNQPLRLTDDTTTTSTSTTSQTVFSPEEMRRQVGTDNLIDVIFGMEVEETLTCEEVSEETAAAAAGAGAADASDRQVVSIDLQRKLVCSIQGGSDQLSTVNINHVAEGIALSLNGKLEKHSNLLNRNAIWTRQDRIRRLPLVLVVQFGRFYWKATPESQDHTGVKCKVMKPIAFSSILDVYDFCTTDLQAKLKVARDYARDEEDLRIEKALQGKAAAAAAKVDGGATAKDGNTTQEATPMDESKDAEDDDEAAALQAALAMSLEPSPPTPPETSIGLGLPLNFQGLYELFAVTTHKGRDADGGHYMSWVKKDYNNGSAAKKIADSDDDNEDWFVFDDEDVSPCKTEDILKLKGGGDWHMSYLNFYRPKK